VEDICLKCHERCGVRICRREGDSEASDEGLVGAGVTDEEDTGPQGGVGGGEGEVDSFGKEWEDGCAVRCCQWGEAMG